MPTIPDFGFCGPSYQGFSPVFDAQRCINFYPEAGAPNAKSRAALIGRPGLSPFITLPTSPVRGLWAGNGRLFAVAGTTVYEVFGNATYQSYGPIPNSLGQLQNGPCKFVENGTQLLVCDPDVTTGVSAGCPQGSVNFIDGGAFTVTLAFQGAALTYLDGFFIAICNGGADYQGLPFQLNVSNSGDGTTWDPLNFATVSGLASRATQVETLNGQLWIFMDKGIELWYNPGNPLFPFARVPGATINIGLYGGDTAQTVKKFVNNILFLGASDNGIGQVYMTRGMNVVSVTPAAIAQFWNNAGQFGSMVGAYSYGYEQGGHIFYVINFPHAFSAYNPGGGAGAVGQTWVYDLTTDSWHERAYTVGTAFSQHLPSCHAATTPGFLSSLTDFVGDSTSGVIYVQDPAWPVDKAAQPITRMITAPHVADRNRWRKYPSFEIYGDLGIVPASPNPNGVVLNYSDNGGRNFIHARANYKGSFDVATGYTRFKWWQLGRSRDRVFQAFVTATAQVPIITDGILDIVDGTEP